jgi:hypothetical protein
VLRAEDQFHAGIVTDDVAATTAELSALLGYEWCDVIDMAVPVVLPSGPATVDMRLVYSRSTPRLEVIRSVAGTVWMPTAGSGIHHLGYWSDDVPADAEQLERGGAVREAAGVDGDGVARWTYHRVPNGPRVELMSRAMAPALEHLWGP